MSVPTAKKTGKGFSGGRSLEVQRGSLPGISGSGAPPSAASGPDAARVGSRGPRASVLTTVEHESLAHETTSRPLIQTGTVTRPRPVKTRASRLNDALDSGGDDDNESSMDEYSVFRRISGSRADESGPSHVNVPSSVSLPEKLVTSAGGPPRLSVPHGGAQGETTGRSASRGRFSLTSPDEGSLLVTRMEERKSVVTISMPAPKRVSDAGASGLSTGSPDRNEDSVVDMQWMLERKNTLTDAEWVQVTKQTRIKTRQESRLSALEENLHDSCRRASENSPVNPRAAGGTSVLSSSQAATVLQSPLNGGLDDYELLYSGGGARRGSATRSGKRADILGRSPLDTTKLSVIPPSAFRMPTSPTDSKSKESELHTPLVDTNGKRLTPGEVAYSMVPATRVRLRLDEEDESSSGSEEDDEEENDDQDDEDGADTAGEKSRSAWTVKSKRRRRGDSTSSKSSASGYAYCPPSVFQVGRSVAGGLFSPDAPDNLGPSAVASEESAAFRLVSPRETDPVSAPQTTPPDAAAAAVAPPRPVVPVRRPSVPTPYVRQSIMRSSISTEAPAMSTGVPQPQPDIYRGRRLFLEDHVPVDFAKILGYNPLHESRVVDSPPWQALEVS